jgi:hypothetical protein
LSSEAESEKDTKEEPKKEKWVAVKGSVATSGLGDDDT